MLLSLNDRLFNVLGYEIAGYVIRLYCKVTEYGMDTDKYTCMMTFSTGFEGFCLVASYSRQNPYEIYICIIYINC